MFMGPKHSTSSEYFCLPLKARKLKALNCKYEKIEESLRSLQKILL